MIYNSKLQLIGGTVEICSEKECGENHEKFQEENVKFKIRFCF
jgi:hypothetical protein